MVERVARALDVDAWRAVDGGEDYHSLRERCTLSKSQAKLAIAAMREPDDRMTYAGYKAINDFKRNFSKDGCGCDWSCSQTAVWQYMIDEALRDG